MQFPQSQCCNNATYQDNCFTGCGQTMPIVPGTNPALQTWNGQFFVVADGSAQNRISLPFLQVNGGAATYIVGADNNGTLSYYSPLFDSAKNLSGGFAGYLPYQSAANTTTFLPIGTAGQVLKVSNTGLPQWATPLAPTAQNITGGAAGEVVYQTAPSTTGFTAQGTTGQVLTSGGTGSPTWTTATNANTASAIVQRDASGNFSAGTITASLSGNATTSTTATTATTATSATTATNIAGGLANQIPYQTGAGATSFISAGTSLQVLLIPSGGGTPLFSGTTGTNGITCQKSLYLSGGVAGAVPYQVTGGQTGFSAAGTSGQVLTSGGTGSPTWTNTAIAKAYASISATAVVSNSYGGVTASVALGTFTVTSSAITTTSIILVTQQAPATGGYAPVVVPGTGSCTVKMFAGTVLTAEPFSILIF